MVWLITFACAAASASFAAASFSDCAARFSASANSSSAILLRLFANFNSKSRARSIKAIRWSVVYLSFSAAFARNSDIWLFNSASSTWKARFLSIKAWSCAAICFAASAFACTRLEKSQSLPKNSPKASIFSNSQFMPSAILPKASTTTPPITFAKASSACLPVLITPSKGAKAVCNSRILSSLPLKASTKARKAITIAPTSAAHGLAKKAFKLPRNPRKPPPILSKASTMLSV